MSAIAAVRIDTHDNEKSAGRASGDTVTLALYAGVGSWHPEGSSDEALTVQAFGEEGGPLLVPGPLVRATVGKTIAVSIRNTLDVPLELHGFGARPMAADVAVTIGPAETYRAKFLAGEPGTYYYWATTTKTKPAQRYGIDSQLSGAFIVDPPNTSPDRVLVMTWWSNVPVGLGAHADKKQLYLINGKSWPHTTRFAYELGDEIRWRIINLTAEPHPMHLHGFYYRVERAGDGLTANTLPATAPRTVVTHVVDIARTLDLTWSPERPGNWLFHCHIVAHIAPERTLRPVEHEHHAGGGMAGLVLGVTIHGKEIKRASPAHERSMQLTMTTIPRRFGEEDGYGFALDGDREQTPGPTLILRRGEPVAVTLINELPIATTIHWHGMELDSYNDGVAGYSGAARSLTPLIEPGGKFVARFTPPRAGTFIYHTHSHDEIDLAKGLYGPLLVIEPDEVYDQTADHVLILGLNGPAMAFETPAAIASRDQVLLNGALAPTLRMRAGRSNRLRFINITPGNGGLEVFAWSGSSVATWTPVAKDGADLPREQRTPVHARQHVSVGETYDFEFTPASGSNWIELRRRSGHFLLQAPVVFDEETRPRS